MPTLNPNKCYKQQPQRLTTSVPETIPSHWRTDFYVRLSTQLKLNDDKTQAQEVYDHHTDTLRRLTKKELFFTALERHMGEQSTYSLKLQLLDSFRSLYVHFTHPKTSEDKRYLIASRIEDNVELCTDGFTNQVNYLITLFNMPQSMDELIAQVRFELVDRIARSIAESNTQGIHVHNRVIGVAHTEGFGVWPNNPGDVYLSEGSEDLTDAVITSHIKTGFANHFQLFALANALRAELEALIAQHGYQGKRALENEYKIEDYEQFIECINRFIPITQVELLELDEDSGKVIDINWQKVKYALLQKLRADKYVTLSEEESALLNKLLLDETSSFDLTTLIPLILQGYELAQCLEFFSEWSMEQKAALVRAYLNQKSPHEQKKVLAILHNEAPQLTAQLKKERNIQFVIAIAEQDATAVKKYVEQGEDINETLLLLFSQVHKSDTLYWLHEYPELLQKLTVAGMNTVINQGKYQGKTVAETLVSTKKGRQLLLDNEALKTLLAQTGIANILSARLEQAKAERSTVSTQAGFFKKSSPQAIELVQVIVYGNLRKSEALLKAAQANSSLLETLLTEKVTVFDYSRRKVKQKTAFQAALCAMDDELCAVLAKYMSKEEMARQYQEIFPVGHEVHYQEQTPFDFSQIVEAFSQCSDADAKKALSLELPNNTELWEKLEKFRADFTQHSSQEAVFNPQHLLKAFELYDSQWEACFESVYYDGWSGSTLYLFWLQVVGFVQRFLPANSAMDFAQGIQNRGIAGERSRRSFNFTHGDGAMFPLSFNSFSALGYEYAAGWWARQPGGYGHGRAATAGFLKLMSSKNNHLGRIMQAAMPQPLIGNCIIL